MATSISYPATEKHDLIFTLGNQRIVDPYAWLEEDSSAALAWQAAQNDLARGQLRSWSGYEKLAELAALSAAPARYPKMNWLPAGDRWFTLTQGGRSGAICLLMTGSRREDPKVLYDPAASSLHIPGTIDWFFPSPDGRHVALGLSAGDEWMTYLHVLDVQTGTFEPQAPRVNGHVELAWTRDSKGFFYFFADFNGAGDSGTLWGRSRIYRYRLGFGTQDQGLDLDGMWTPPHVSDDGRYAYVYDGIGQQRPYFIKSLYDDSPWRPFLRDQPGSIVGVVLKDRFLAIETDTGCPRGRVVAIPIDTAADRSSWKELVPMGKRILRSPALAGDRLVVHGFEDLQTKLWVFGSDGQLLHEVVPDEPGSVAPASARPTGGWDDVQPIIADKDGAGFSFHYTSYTVSPRRFHFDIATGKLEDRSDEPAIRLTDLEVSRRSFRTQDGKDIAIFLVTRKGHDLSKPSPTFLTAYGAFRNVTLPSYLGALAAFVRSGGVFAEAVIRGGGEHGHDWWQSGRYALKQDSFNDVYASAEYLFSSGITAKGRLAFYGCSHGGMLAGTVLTQRPDLFGAVVIGAPVIDLLRFHLDPYLAWSCTKEYGNPVDDEQAKWLASYSPYHHVRSGVDYPPTLVICGEQDARTRPLHGRKVSARLQEVGAPIALFRVFKGRHQQICDRASNPGQIAEWLGFVMKHLGVEPADAAAIKS